MIQTLNIPEVEQRDTWYHISPEEAHLELDGWLNTLEQPLVTTTTNWEERITIKEDLKEEEDWLEGGEHCI